MNQFLSQYNKNVFTKVGLEDETDLKGYEYLGTGRTFSLMSLKENLTEKYVNIYTTKKPLGTSLKDLGISLTGGAVPVEVTFSKEGWLAKVFDTVGPLVLFILVMFLFMKFALPK